MPRRLRGPAAGRATAAVLVLLLTAPIPAAASSGDMRADFRRCLGECQARGCAPPVGAVSSLLDPRSLRQQRQTQQQAQEAEDLTQERCSSVCALEAGSGHREGTVGVPLALRLWVWDCRADCSYLCMWQVESAKPPGQPPDKYYGKWPFARLGGMQEPASVAFSLLNLVVHAWCLRRYLALRRRLLQQDAPPLRSAQGGVPPPLGPATGRPYPYAWALVTSSALSCNAWVWSAVFHGRDTRLTERLDYMSAAASVLQTLFMTLLRVGGVRSRLATLALGGAILLLLLRHMHYMLFVLFDYGYNMRFCLAAGAVQTLTWVGWGVLRGRGHPGRRPLLAFFALVNAAMLLEVLDFPPLWQVLDAHALWHLATIPITFLWYCFAEADLELGNLPAAGAAPAAGAGTPSVFKAE